MDDLKKQDVFSVLGIDCREDSYSELIANVLQHRLEWAGAFLGESFSDKPPRFPVTSVETRMSLYTDDDKRVTPDLLFFCGDKERPKREIYWIEAKIRSREGEGQTKQYKKAMSEYAKEEGADRSVGGFITLDDRKPQCDDVAFFTYKPLVDIVEPGRIAQEYPWMEPVVSALVKRLAHYYEKKREVEEGEELNRSQSLKDFLKQEEGLVTSADLFHWLTYRARKVAEFEFETEADVTHNSGTAHPLRTFHLPDWRSEPLGDGCSLAECRWIHFEVQTAPEREDVSYLVLHYHTYPYEPGLAKLVSEGRNGLTLAEYEQYWQRRTRFAKVLAEELKGTNLQKDWERVVWDREIPKGRNVNQLTRQKKKHDFSTHETVGRFEEWLGSGLKDMAGVVNRALLKAG